MPSNIYLRLFLVGTSYRRLNKQGRKLELQTQGRPAVMAAMLPETVQLEGTALNQRSRICTGPSNRSHQRLHTPKLGHQVRQTFRGQPEMRVEQHAMQSNGR